tara:strand:+ start:1076 stop:1195 length:120 start_codon:yes stop_codon:yes gene_type:complete
MWEDIKWWVVLTLTIISFLVLPGLIQMLWEELKKFKENK